MRATATTAIGRLTATRRPDSAPCSRGCDADSADRRIEIGRKGDRDPLFKRRQQIVRQGESAAPVCAMRLPSTTTVCPGITRSWFMGTMVTLTNSSHIAAKCHCRAPPSQPPSVIEPGKRKSKSGDAL